MIDEILKITIKETLENRSVSKVDWTGSPFIKTKLEGKNAVGDFGENLIKNLYESQGKEAEIIKKGHDVLADNKKIEVKTAFQNKAKGFFFNQIYYEKYVENEIKDWDHLAFVFVSPFSIEVWECKRPKAPEEHFIKNNGWAWHKNSPSRLCGKTWKKTYTWSKEVIND
tara:strand:- start:351 stop:857 length:507 start_codon:yes stop_codon:yes gene_type:complete